MINSPNGIFIVEPTTIHADSRGSLASILPGLIWAEANFITSREGVIRGNHFHIYSTELFIIRKGSILVRSSQVFSDELNNYRRSDMISEKIFSDGDVFAIYPMTWHQFHVRTASEWHAFMSTPHTSTALDIIQMD